MRFLPRVKFLLFIIRTFAYEAASFICLSCFPIVSTRVPLLSVSSNSLFEVFSILCLAFQLAAPCPFSYRPPLLTSSCVFFSLPCFGRLTCIFTPPTTRLSNFLSSHVTSFTPLNLTNPYLLPSYDGFLQ